MKCLILLAVLAAAVAEQYVDKEYLVGLQPGTNVEAFAAKLPNIELKKSWDLGMTVLLHIRGEEFDVAKISKLAEVKYVERNGIAHTEQCSSISASGCWGLDRIDQTGGLGYSNPTDPGAVYNYGQATGNGVTAYIVDTGIETGHSDFGGRAFWAFNAVDGDDFDGNGHGTHCAGTIGSNSYGVARSTRLGAVKVLQASGSGPWSAVIGGLDWIRNGHSAGARTVASMSLGGGGITQSVIDATEALVAAGVPVAVAAGNSNADGCNYTPSAAPNAITVGASDVNDVSASFTNWGTCLDVFAPGVSVLSTWIGGGTNTISGTSMATPHVAGAVARYQSAQASAPSSGEVNAWVVSTATPNVLSWSGSNHDTSPNRLLFAPCPL